MGTATDEQDRARMGTLNIHVPSVPSALKITHTMWEDFLCDPVLAAWIIFGIGLDAFQAARLRYYWWVQFCMDSSGYNSGKTIVDFLFANLRAILIPDQRVGIYYPVFDTGKNTFWTYFKEIKTPMFRAQLGEINEKGEESSGTGRKESGGYYEACYRNGNNLLMPAPSMMRDAATQASMRFNTVLIEEWHDIDKRSNAIDAQLLGRASRQSWSQDHPIWGNHILLTGPAKTRMHPAYARYRAQEMKVKQGNPGFASLHYSFKDFSNLRCPTGKTYREQYRIRSNIEARKAAIAKADWLGDGFGIWAANGVGWFTEEAILNCIEMARRRGVRPVLGRGEMEGTVQE